ncbi:MAG: hypothetical protein US70_C0010G0020 [Parcubacteria group bacterium GW2011_GWD2_38_11]|nr:MAG: hypothetical protein US70_C0010G0020 [Parcubacteria group bacterium GW2011_GWD2_38_11]
MNFTLLGKLIWAIQTQINAAKKECRKYDFQETKRHILDVYKNEVGADRDLYSKAISSHFGKLGAQALKMKRQEIKKLIAVLKKIEQQKIIREAEEFWLQEKIRSGSVELSPEGDICLLEDEAED